MKILRLYEDILSEQNITSCVRKFGHELFGQELGGKEPDTSVEKQYVNLIQAFTHTQFGQKVDKNLITALKNLKGCTAQYPQVLIPEHTKIYRGTMIPLRYFVDNRVFHSFKPFPYTYQAHNAVQSWTTDDTIAGHFGHVYQLQLLYQEFTQRGYNASEKSKQKFLNWVRKEKLDTRIPFVLSSMADDSEFLFKAKYFDMLSANKSESEILRISKVPMKVYATFNPHSEDDPVTQDEINFFTFLITSI